jgi:hypothetical protein
MVSFSTIQCDQMRRNFAILTTLVKLGALFWCSKSPNHFWPKATLRQPIFFHFFHTSGKNSHLGTISAFWSNFWPNSLVALFSQKTFWRKNLHT